MAMLVCWLRWVGIATALLGASMVGASEEFRSRPAAGEFIYFVLPDRFENGDPANDRGGLNGDRLVTGFDPTAKGFYNGGDLKGLLQRLDYIQSLGATAIWLGPIFKNKPVQGPPGQESAGYHGYWITDFTQVDPHFGTAADLHALVDAAHARGMKLYLDIIANHTADVIAYRECPKNDCAYRSLAAYPYTRRGGVNGSAINAGFAGSDAAHQSAANFALLTRSDYAYTPYIPAGEENSKVPAWLNDPIYYHNRGNSTFRGESAEQGDFSGLDDLMTENPRVVQGFIDIYGKWIDDYGLDGFRIDTAKHVNPEFWQAFVPAMRARAAAQGIANFHIFGEIFTDKIDPALLARYTHTAGLPAVLDFAFAAAVRATVAGNRGTEVLADLFANDVLYEGGAASALQLPTFISNHDMGRFAWFVRKDLPKTTDAEVLQRVALAHAMLLTLRGAPTLYYGDEQGFAGFGGDQDARQDMFATRVARYVADRRVGPPVDTHAAAFNPDHPLYRLIAELAQLRKQHPALARGLQITRSASPRPGVFAVSRLDPDNGDEILIAFNTSTRSVDTSVVVDSHSQQFQALHGQCAASAQAPGSYRVRLAPLDFIICAAGAH
ncbi:MAG: alpha-amylase family glycosyl hydrolase [Steroidobacteraceae bacterium]